jgi:hypothetical protein
MADTYSLSGLLSLAISMTHTKTQDDGAVASDPISKTISQTLTYGAAATAGAVQDMFHERRTLTTGATYEYDLAGGLTDEFGQTLTFTAIKGIIIHSTSADNKVLTVGAGTDELVGWVGDATDVVNIHAGGLFCLLAPNTGYTVTAGSADDLLITNAAGGSSTYDIIIIGNSS